MERLNAFTLLKSVDSGKLFQALIILHAKKRLLAELVGLLLGLYSLYISGHVLHSSMQTSAVMTIGVDGATSA